MEQFSVKLMGGANELWKSKRLPLETKNILRIENGSLGFIETLYKQ